MRDRSHRFKADYSRTLKARLCEVELQKREAEKVVQEAIINAERTAPQKVLDGDLDEFMAPPLAARVGQHEKAA